MQILFLNIDKRPVLSVSRMSNTMGPAQRRGEKWTWMKPLKTHGLTHEKPGHTDKMSERKIVIGSWSSFIPTAMRRLMFYLPKYGWANYTSCQNCMLLYENIVFYLCIYYFYFTHIICKETATLCITHLRF